MKAAFIVAALAFCPVSAFADQTPTTHATTSQVPAYELELDVDPEQGLIQGDVSLTLPPGAAVNRKKIYLRLLMNAEEAPNPKIFPFYETGTGPEGFSPGSARVSDLTVNGEPTTVSYAAAPLYFTTYNLTRLFAEIDLSQVDEESAAIVRFHYQVKLPREKGEDDFHFGDKMISRFSWFPYVAREDQLGVLVFEPFTYKARISVAPGWDMVRIGILWERNGTDFTVESGLPVSSFPLVFLKGFHVYSVGWLKDQKRLLVYHEPTAEEAARLVSAYAREALEYYAQRYFPYEASCVSIVQANPGPYGMAADSLVLLGDAIFGGVDRILPGLFARPMEYTIAHELGHLYWGIGSPVDFLTENYLSEGLNEYSTLLWYEGKYGRWDNLYSAQADVLGRAAVTVTATLSGHSYASMKHYSVHQNRSQGWDEPLSGPRAGKIDNAQAVVDYDKAWFVLSMLARYVGRDLFQSALSDFAAEYRYRTITSRDLQSYLSRVSGKDLESFFNAFVYGTKSLDYELTGRLNEPAPEGFTSRFTVRDDNDSGIFVPSSLTIFLRDGSTMEVPVPAAGTYDIHTFVQVDYVGVDRDAENLDDDRKNNFWPRRVVFAGSTDYWLLDGATDKIYPPLLPYVGEDRDSGSSDLGAGMTLTDDLSYSIGLNAFGSIPADTATLDAYGLGLNLGATAKLGGNLSMGFDATWRYPSRISWAGITLAKAFSLPIDVGSSGRTMDPVFAFETSVGIVGLDFADFSMGYAAGDASFAVNLLPTLGTRLVLSNSTRVRWNPGSVEDMVSLDLAQGIPFLPMTLLGAQIRASASFGALASFRGSNAALGHDSTGSAMYPYDAGARAFLGLPLFNDIGLQALNIAVLQSLNLALVYEAGIAFTDPATQVSVLQQAAGIELLPLIRTLGDLQVGLAIGMSLDLNAIAAQPNAVESYAPLFYIDLSVLPSLFNAVMPY